MSVTIRPNGYQYSVRINGLYDTDFDSHAEALDYRSWLLDSLKAKEADSDSPQDWEIL